MQRGTYIFIAGTVILSAVIISAGAPLMANPKTQGVGGAVLFLSALVPFAMAYIAQRASGAPGNPFKGLVWGPTSYYFATWLGALVVGFAAAAISLGLGLARFDPDLTDYVEMAKTQAEEKSGQELPSQAESAIKITGIVLAALGPTLAPWFLTAFLCLSSFPWLGYMFRRLLVNGKLPALAILMAIWLVLGSAGGLVNNPMASELSMPVRMLLNAAMAAAMAPALVWLFLRTGSAVIPALGQATWQGILSSCTFVFSDVNKLLSVPLGVIGILCVLMAGIALWIWKDPGGEQLEVAAVASDGTPLTRSQVEAISIGGVPTVVPPSDAAAPL